VRVLAISGSLQARSSNSWLLRTAARVAPVGDEVVDAGSVGDLPHFNPDLDADGAPHAVAELRAALVEADAVIIASPEYAHSLPGALKNALDWIVGSGELYGKPVAILSGSPREDGARYGRAALEQTLRAQGAVVAVSRTVAVATDQGDEPNAGVDQVLTAVLDELRAAVTSRTDEP
jgi:NAD(P)H-dependent FMN reductase